ncbi:hypothetical protein BN946_scf184747.g22 [Trametes cinnabarina]|uniref:Uncharacterized protein n=1 Tax=Pycnoporus cinnabarinus TaxID=5643 RepID=A0A060SY90_PYCCI|nr:hypothetical protein BN946_scf184747.g22 [Trametes cinnabarina]
MDDTTPAGKPIVDREKTAPFLIPPNSTEYRHPLARYSFRAVFADATARGRFTHKELGTVYSRDILGEPGTLDHPAPRLLEDVESESVKGAEQDRTLDELRFVPGDYLCVAVHLPKGATAPAGPAGELAIKGSAAEAVDTGEVPPGLRPRSLAVLAVGAVVATLAETGSEMIDGYPLLAGNRLHVVRDGADGLRLGPEVRQGGEAGTTELFRSDALMYL